MADQTPATADLPDPDEDGISETERNRRLDARRVAEQAERDQASGQPGS